MSNASGSRHQMAYIAEVAYGTTPATPAFKRIRHNSTSLALNRESLQSEEIRSDRQLNDFRLGQHTVPGDITCELGDNTHDDLLEAVLCGTWSTNVLKAGTTRRSFSIERHFSDIDKYLRYTGIEFNTFALTVAPSAIVSAVFGVMGQTQVSDTVAIAGSSYADTSLAAPYDGFSGVIEEGGATIAVVTEVSLSLTNNLATMPVIGSLFGLQPSIGRSIVTGSISAYFESLTLLNKFINETTSSLEFTLGSGGSGLTFLVPKIKYTGGQPDVSGEGPITLAMPFQALYDSTEQTNLKITRNAS